MALSSPFARVVCLVALCGVLGSACADTHYEDALNPRVVTHSQNVFAVDPATKARTLREAGAAFAAISKARDVPADLEQKYARIFP